MKFLRQQILLISSVLVTLLMLIGVGMVGHDALTIREAEEIEEDASKALLHAEQWLNHQEEIEVAVRSYVISGEQRYLDAIADNRQLSVEHIQGMKDVISEYEVEAEAEIRGLLKLTERHQQLVDQIVAGKKTGDSRGAGRILASERYAIFIDGARLIMTNFTRGLQEERSAYNSKVSLNVLRGSISFGSLAFLMILTIWTSYFITARMQRRNQELTAQLAFEATHDTLTGLPNRRYIYDRLSHAIALASRHKRRLALMAIDLDGFKAVNDIHGHDAGDTVLREVARRFKQTSRTSDYVVRTGGDEFALVAEDVEEISSLQHLAQRLVECLAEPIELAGQSKAVVGCSVGISIYPDHASDLDELFATADRAMYAAKESGKNCWRAAQSKA